MPLYKRQLTEDELNEEINEDENQEELQEKQEDEELTAEEKNWKKRYGDLRRYKDQEDKKRDKRIADLEAQLEQTGKDNFQLPTSEEELTEWMEKFPDVAKIIKTIAIKTAKESEEQINKKFKSIEEKENELAEERARIGLEKLHPDFFTDIAESDEFIEWLGTKSQRMQDALYVNNTDVQAAAEVISLYKLEVLGNKGKKTASRDNRRDAATDVKANGRVNLSGKTEHLFSESQIEAMSQREYEENEDAINKAISEGKFLYDISGE